MVDLGPYAPLRRSPDDPVEALTEEDRQWLEDHGWQDTE